MRHHGHAAANRSEEIVFHQFAILIDRRFRKRDSSRLADVVDPDIDSIVGCDNGFDCGGHGLIIGHVGLDVMHVAGVSILGSRKADDRCSGGSEHIDDRFAKPC